MFILVSPELSDVASWRGDVWPPISHNHECIPPVGAAVTQCLQSGVNATPEVGASPRPQCFECSQCGCMPHLCHLSQREHGVCIIVECYDGNAILILEGVDYTVDAVLHDIKDG